MKRDLRAELLAAEQEARNKKRKAEGKPPLPVEGAPVEDDEANKRRKVLQEALELDKDDDDEGEDKEAKANEDGEEGR
jgi:protein CWC15